MHSSKVKFQIVLDVLKEKQSQTEIARNYCVHSNLISRWKDQLLKNGHKLFESESNLAAPDKEKDKKIDELEQIIGKQTVEIALLKKFLGHYRSD